MGWWWFGLHTRLHQPPWSFGFDSKREEPGKTGCRPVLKYRVPHGSQPRPGWAPDPLMDGQHGVDSCPRAEEVLSGLLSELNLGRP